MTTAIDSATASRSLANQVKISTIASSYPHLGIGGGLTPMGAIAAGAPVDASTTKRLATDAFNQGQFFKSFSKVNFDQLTRRPEANGDEVWSYEESIDGVAHSVTLRKSEVLGSISLTRVQSQSEIAVVARQYKIEESSTYVTIGGEKYFVRMNVPLHFGTGSQTSVIMDTMYFVVGSEALAAAIAGVVTTLGIDAFSVALASINAAVFRVLWSVVAGLAQITYGFLQAFVGAIMTGESVAAALAAGQLAVGEVFAGGAFTAVTASALAYTVVGILVIAAIFLILTYALHHSYQNVYVYNLTKYDLDFDFGYVYEGNPHNLESKHLPARQRRVGPRNIDLGSWYSGTAFRFQSDSQFHGLGYALSIALKDAGTQHVRKRMACLFDVPFVGSNSLHATATAPGDIHSYYANKEGVLTKTQDSQTDGELELIVTYDYLDGTHRNPETRSDEYIYNSLVIVREKVAQSSLGPRAELSNDGFLSVPNIPAYAFGKGDFCLEARVKPDGPGTLFGKKGTAGGSERGAGFLMVLQPNGAIKLATDNGVGFSQTLTSATALFDGQWHHVVGMRHGGKLIVYLDGQPLSATPSGHHPSPLEVSNALALQIGAVEQRQEQHVHYRGAISEVRVWNVALTEQQVRDHLKTAPSGATHGLVGYWPLRDNTHDLSRYGNSAQVKGSVHFPVR